MEIEAAYCSYSRKLIMASIYDPKQDLIEMDFLSKILCLSMLILVILLAVSIGQIHGQYHHSIFLHNNAWREWVPPSHPSSGDPAMRRWKYGGTTATEWSWLSLSRGLRARNCSLLLDTNSIWLRGIGPDQSTSYWMRSKSRIGAASSCTSCWAGKGGKLWFSGTQSTRNQKRCSTEPPTNILPSRIAWYFKLKPL